MPPVFTLVNYNGASFVYENILKIYNYKVSKSKRVYMIRNRVHREKEDFGNSLEFANAQTFQARIKGILNKHTILPVCSFRTTVLLVHKVLYSIVFQYNEQ